VHIWHSMQWRSTTRKADEAVCLAILLYLDPSPLLECSEEERLPKIFASLRSVPPDIVFCPGEKIQYPGLRVGDILGAPAERYLGVVCYILGASGFVHHMLTPRSSSGHRSRSSIAMGAGVLTHHFHQLRWNRMA
jgi:hypothetical protein